MLSIEKQGIVSIWLGNINTQSHLEEYVNLTYDEDGESFPSNFSWILILIWMIQMRILLKKK
ncbi:immunity 22 family protein [Fictibacillus sp. 5RED26]|uniref:immunity 22 family protein n=1 Tax=Fictibacillus sp. 5RED26 TaxID=2745876 RepID=UPI00351CD2A9